MNHELHQLAVIPIDPVLAKDQNKLNYVAAY